ncbi:MAG TPA: protein kinase [Pirellulaceae bacterium]|nr:protein kinase [Pirellulaceae bacterium]
MRTYSPGDEPIPGYRLIDQLGQGSFGVVWQAEGPGGVLVAMKVISNLNGIHAIREWQSLQNVMNLKQANLVEIYGVWLKDEQGQVLRPEEVRALIPPEAEVAAPVTETSVAAPAAIAPRKAVWAGDKRIAKPAAAPHKLEGATLQPEDDLPTAGAGNGSTAADSSQPSESPSAGTGSAKDAASAKDSTGSKESVSSGSRGKWSKAGGVPPLELVSAMTLGEGTLMSRLKQCQGQGHRGIPRPELLRYMMEAAKGLAYLNDRKMHHCDVKPENLLLVGGSVKVCDYGSALRTIYSAESRTHQGYTEQYAAPEQLSGRKVKLHASTDMYALALTYYALRTGKYPWGDLSTEPIAVVKYSEKFDFSALAKQSRYPYEWQVIRKALKRTPEERFPTTIEFVETLENAARREEEATRARRRRRIRNLALAVMAVLLIGAGVGVWINRDKLPSWAPIRSTEDQFNSAVVANDVVRAVGIANAAEPALNPSSVAAGIATALQNLPADQLQEALEKTFTLKPEYRQALGEAVGNTSISHFQATFRDQIASHDYPQILEAVAQDQGLKDWQLDATVRDALLDQWLQKGRATLADAAHDPQRAGESVKPLAALANAVADDSARRSEIDSVVQKQLGAWLDSAESMLGKVPELSAAREEFRFLAAAANSYLQARSDAPAEIRTLRAIAQLGELAARFRLASEPSADLAQALAAISDADLLSSPAAQSRRILLTRASAPANDPELVSDRFLTSELPLLRSLPPGWQQETLDEIKKRAIEVAKKQHAAGQLANIDAVLSALQDDRLTLDFVRDALAAAASAADETAFTKTVDLARQRLDPLPEKLEKPTDEQARSVLQAWLTLLDADSPAAGQVTAVVQTFEAWGATASGDTRAAAWFPGFVEGLARRPRRWPAEFLSSEIAELESAAATSTSRIDRHLAALALRSQRLLILAVEPMPTDEQLAQIEQDSERLVAARDDEEDGELIGRFVDPSVLVDALWAETQLAQVALSKMARPAIEPDVKGALDRLTQYLKDQPASGADEEDFTPYLKYVADVHRVIAPPPGDTLDNVLPPPSGADAWLAPPRRHAVAAALLLELADRAGTPPFTRGADLSTYSDTFGRQRPRLESARAWATAGSDQKIAAEARLALALFYGGGERDWKSILDAAQSATADRQACQSVISPVQYSHVLLVHAEALRQAAPGDDPSALIHILAELLARECDLYDGSKGCLADADLYERVAAPALALIGDESPGKATVPPADLAAIYGGVGTLLERDTSRRIAVDHYEFNSGPDQYAQAMLDSFQRASEHEADPTRKLRWLAGQGLALDRQAELMPRDDYSSLVKDLEAIAGRMEELDTAYFAAPALRGLAAFYSAPKVNDLADLDSGEKQREAALAGFRLALTSLEQHPQGGSPWCRSWQSTIQRLASHICLQQSWNLTWGPQMQTKLQEAIQFASEAKRSAPDRLEEAQASSTLGNAYEDMAFYLKCVPFYERAEKEFQAAQKAVADVDPFQEFLFRRNLIRVQYRRLSHDPALADDVRKAWRQKLPADMEQLLEDTKTRRLDRYQTFTEFWLADMLSTLLDGDIPALERAEDLYKKIPPDASAKATAKRYYLAGDCAMRLAILHEEANQPAKSDEAMNRARRYMEPILPLEKELTDAGSRSEIAQLRGDIAADRQDSVDGEFAQYVAECQRSAAVGGLSPEESARLQIRLHLMVGATPCKSEENHAARQEAIDEAFRLLVEQRALLDEREYATLLLRATNIALERAVAYHKPPRTTPLPAWDLLALGKRALDAARQAEKQIGQVECCATPMEPSVGKVTGYDSVWETRGLRMAIAKNLMKPIYDSPKSKPERAAELTWIRTQLEDLKKALPREGEQANAMRTRIDRDYLRLLVPLLDELKRG